MSHQGFEGWSPECIVCHKGNLPAFVCLSPVSEDEHGDPPAVADEGLQSELFQADGHWWKRCALCPEITLSDPAAWGSKAYCLDCWNHFASRGLYPPMSARHARQMSDREWGWRD